jgi:hypothetical protein
MKKETSSKYQQWHSNIGNDENEWENFVKDFYKEEWDKIDGNEKAVCMTYETQLKKSEMPSAKLIKVINEIQGKYPDLCISYSPKKKEPIKPINFMTQDFSGYLPSETK